MNTKLNIEEIKTTLKYIIHNNKRLASLNKKTSAVELMGESGIGKTSMLLQLAEELEMDCVKLNLAQLDELGDLIGFPLKEYSVEKNGEYNWIPKDLLDIYVKNDYTVTGENRMGYALPSWLPTTDNENGTLLILDDFNRADQRFTQAVMELK